MDWLIDQKINNKVDQQINRATSLLIKKRVTDKHIEVS